MYVDFGDSDALLQENGYTLDQASEFLRQGYSIYVDASTKVTAATNYDTSVTATEDNVTIIYGDYDTTLTIDMWYGDKFVPRKYGADASFYGNDGEYRGNIYNESGKIIGDYTSDNSILIEKNFLIDFGE